MPASLESVLSVITQSYPLMLDVGQTAELIGVHPNTIHNWIAAGRCPFPTRKIGGLRRVSAVDLAAFILSGSPMARRGRPRKKADLG